MTDYTEKDCLELETINDFLRLAYSWARQSDLFFGHGTDNAWDDMRQLILGSLALPYDIADVLLESRLLGKEKKYLYSQMRKRIVDRIPVPYLTHEAYFCGLPFYIDERVLIPRSPLAELIQEQFAPWVEPSQVELILDMCTGSACIAIACCYAFPDAEVDAVDISVDALAVAKINQEKHGLEDQLNLIQSDCFKAISNVRYDIIVSNPPYVGGQEMKTLPEEYRHEPVLALEAADNGLAIVDNILRNAQHFLSKEGILVLEVGNSDELVMETYPDLPLTWLEFEHGGHGVFVVSSEQLADYFESH